MKQAFKAWVAHNIMVQVICLTASAITHFLIINSFLDVWPVIAAIGFIGLNILWFVVWLWCAVLQPWTEK